MTTKFQETATNLRRTLERHEKIYNTKVPENKINLFNVAIEAAFSTDPELMLEAASAIGTNKDINQGGPNLIYGAFHLASAALFYHRGDDDRAQMCLRAAREYVAKEVLEGVC